MSFDIFLVGLKNGVKAHVDRDALVGAMGSNFMRVGIAERIDTADGGSAAVYIEPDGCMFALSGDVSPRGIGAERYLTERTLAVERRLERCARGQSRARLSGKSPVSRDIEGKRSETEVERETGSEAPSTNRRVRFTYRLS